MVVNRFIVLSDRISKFAMYKDKPCFHISLQNENESHTVNSLMVYSLRNDIKFFVRLYVVLPIVDKIGHNCGTSLAIRLNL